MPRAPLYTNEGGWPASPRLARQMQGALHLRRKERKHRVIAQDRSVLLDGSTQFLRSATSTLGFADEWSVMAWVKRTDADAGARLTVHIREAAAANNEILFFRASGGSENWGVQVKDSAGTLIKAGTVSSTIIVDEWMQLGLTFDGSLGGDPFLMYSQGVDVTPVLATDLTGTMTDSSRRITFGANNGGTQVWEGPIHSLALWNRALDPDEWFSLFNKGRGQDFDLNRNLFGYTSSPNLVHWFRAGKRMTPEIGLDYAESPPAVIDLEEEAAAIDDTDLVYDVPELL